MLVTYRPSWARILKQIGKPLIASIALSFATTALHHSNVRTSAFEIPDLPLSITGSAIALLLTFRTNSAYARWWEARTLWGGLVNNSRTWARQILALPDPSTSFDLRSAAIRLQIAYIHALRDQLRGKGSQPPPLALLQRMSISVNDLFRAEKLGEFSFLALQATLTELTNLQGGCERIRNTPLPRQYDYWPEIFVFVYCLMLPFAVVRELSWLTPLITGVVAFVFLVLNRIGRNLEDPFHSSVYGTPVNALSRVIENDLLAAIGETPLPALQPVDGVLD